MEGEHFVASPDGGMAKAETPAAAEEVKTVATVEQEADKAPETESEEAKPEEAGTEGAEVEASVDGEDKSEDEEVAAIDEKLDPEEHVADAEDAEEEKPEE